jgi:segregation and condensation protein B
MHNPLPTIASQIHAILFYTAEDMSFAALAKTLGVQSEEIGPAVAELQENLVGTGLILLVQENIISLAVAPLHSDLIAAMQKDAFSKELSKAQGEVLAIVCYMGEASKTDIEFIRGVQSVYSIRALVSRGLIAPSGTGRSVVYMPTIDMLREFGITTVSELPGYAEQSIKVRQLLENKEL